MKNSTEDMKLQLNEQTLNAYINEAIKQELNEDMLQENIKINFDALGKPANQNGKERSHFKKRASKGRFGRFGLRTSKGAVRILKKMGYSDEQIRNGILSGAIQIGERVNDNEFKKYSDDEQRRKEGRLIKRTGISIDDLNNYYNNTKPENYPWSNIPDDQIAWGQNRPARNRPVKPTPAQQTQPAQQTEPSTTNNNPTDNSMAQETPTRTPIGKLEAPQFNVPTGVTGQKLDIKPDNLATNTINAMTKIAMAKPSQVSQREKDAALRRMKTNAIATTRNANYGPTAKQDRRLIKTGYNSIKKGNNNPAI